MEPFRIIWWYLEIINLASLALMGADKLCLRKKKRGIPESILLLSVVCGGGIGALGGMFLFRHKKHAPKFTIGVPVILFLQAAFFVLLFVVVGQE